jgi:hypothetical protein
MVSFGISGVERSGTIARYLISYKTGIGFILVSLGDLVVSVLATGPKVRGFKPGRVLWILRAIKSAARLASEGK